MSLAGLELEEVWNSSNKNSRWSFDPRNGLTLQNPTVSDSANYYVFGHLPFVNGKPVNITHSNDSFKRHRIQKIIRKIFPSVDRISAIDVILFAFDDPGNRNLWHHSRIRLVKIECHYSTRDRSWESGSTWWSSGRFKRHPNLHLLLEATNMVLLRN